MDNKAFYCLLTVKNNYLPNVELIICLPFINISLHRVLTLIV